MAPLRNLYQKKMETQLDEWTDEIEKLKSRMKATAKSRRSIDALQNQLDRARQKLQTLKDARGDAWEDFKLAVEKAWSDLKTALDLAKSGSKPR
jgi:gas vesicle protein